MTGMRKKRSAGSLSLVILVAIIIIAAFSFASKHDEEDAQTMAAEYAANRQKIIAACYLPQGE